MDKLDRIYALHGLLKSARIPVSRQVLEQKLECSHATVERIIHDLRLYYDAPIEYSHDRNGYFYNAKANSDFELPGIWFTPEELYGLLTSYQLLSEIDSGILDTYIQPIKSKLSDLLQKKLKNNINLFKRVRIIKIATRETDTRFFSQSANALFNRARITIYYLGRDRNTETQRSISPQTLVYYRDNWYLDAWCHLRNELRTFALDRIINIQQENTSAKEIDEQVLKNHYTTSYGIFSGEPDKIAILKFSAQQAQWIAREQWHPQQQGRFEGDSYILELPYKDNRELVQDIMKFAEDVEVIKPAELRNTISKKIKKMAEIYK